MFRKNDWKKLRECSGDGGTLKPLTNFSLKNMGSKQICCLFHPGERVILHRRQFWRQFWRQFCRWLLRKWKIRKKNRLFETERKTPFWTILWSRYYLYLGSCRWHFWRKFMVKGEALWEEMAEFSSKIKKFLTNYEMLVLVLFLYFTSTLIEITTCLIAGWKLRRCLAFFLHLWSCQLPWSALHLRLLTQSIALVGTSAVRKHGTAWTCLRMLLRIQRTAACIGMQKRTSSIMGRSHKHSKLT